MAARTNQQTLDAVKLVQSGMSIKKASLQVGVHRSTIWRNIKKKRPKEKENK